MSDAAAELLERLDRRSRELLQLCGKIASERGEAAYLVGGVVRDLLLERPSEDLDVVVEGDGMAVAQALARHVGGQLTRYHAFQTARVDGPEGARVDVATARSEEYPRPGQLPRVEPGTLIEDLERRDFTINTLAISLEPASAGELVDPFDGRRDLRDGVVRILHGRSFADDPTRVLRALRFAQRFGYRLEEETEAQLREAVAGGYLDTVSGDRIRRELEKLLREAPVEGPVLLDEHGVLAELHRGLCADRPTLEALEELRRWFAGIAPVGATDEGGDVVPWTVALAACAGGLSSQDRWRLARRLRLSRQERQPLVGAGAPWSQASDDLVEPLAEDGPPSRVAEALDGLDAGTLLVGTAMIRGTGEPDDGGRPGPRRIGSAVRSYLAEYRHVAPELDGDDLLELGVPEGPEVGRILRRLRAARLDGEVASRRQEEALVRDLLAG